MSFFITNLSKSSNQKLLLSLLILIEAINKLKVAMTKFVLKKKFFLNILILKNLPKIAFLKQSNT